MKRGCAAICPDGEEYAALPAFPNTDKIPYLSRCFDDRKQDESVGYCLFISFGCILRFRLGSLAFADAEELQKKVERLRGRVHELEDALRTLQANISDHPHPLLTGSPAMASMPNSPVPPSGTGPTTLTSKEEEEFIDAFGAHCLFCKSLIREFTI